MALGMEVGLSPGDFVLDGDLLSQKGVEPPPQFSAHFYCGQTAGCIKISLGTEVGLSTGDSVFDVDPVPALRPMSIVAKRLDGSRWHLAWTLVQATMC